jgi:riboflavin kinase/FMN adenylyltransferase
MPPRLALTGDTGYQQIYTKEERYEILKKMGMDVLIEYPFTKEFASLSPDAFVKDILVGQVGAKVVVVGTDFRFGSKRSGSVNDLERLSGQLGYQLIVMEKLQDQHGDISSSRIRSLIEKGQMEEVNKLLGRPYSIFGEVVHGKALGRTIKIPTANQLANPGKLIPPNGVYVSQIRIDEDIYYGITNIGIKPTVDQSEIKGIETYIFDFDEDIYGKNIEVGLLHFRRPEMRFDSIENLTKQMQKDIAFGKDYINKF